ncbi:MAG: FHA domain-containing protein [Oscillochloridaceae bacterium]|nr:FHA domain-containing protein [Chloroflexaceae bacterium]MDW8391768.1 FHA domain-containing protein [Oscillochloridaceae bacterium]
MAKALSLIGISGSRAGQSLLFSARSTIVGTDPQCGVVLQDRLILPRHAEFRMALERWFVVSLDPRAAIFVNGQPVTGQQRVEHGSLVTLGGTTFRAVIGELERAVGEGDDRTQREPEGREDWWRD